MARVDASRLCLFGGFLLTCGLPAVYVINASHEWRAGVGLFPLQHWRWLPASAYPEGSLHALGLSVLLAACLWATAFLRSRARMLLVALILAETACIVLLVFQQRLLPRPASEWSCLFVSRNQFAAFTCLVFPVALAIGARVQSRAFLEGRLSNPSAFLYLMAALFAGAIILTGSRAGIVVMTLQMAGFVLIQWKNRRRYPFAMLPFSKVSKVFLSVFAALVLASGAHGVWRHQSSVRRVSSDLSFRSSVMGDTWAMWRSRKWWGTGPGTFAIAFPYYQTLPLEKYYFKHAHCEPLQFLAEFGILGGGLEIIGILMVLKGAVRKGKRCIQVPAFHELEGCGLLLALGGVGLHSLVDFPFRHPLILILACVWGGLLAGCRVIPCKEHTMQQAV